MQEMKRMITNTNMKGHWYGEGKTEQNSLEIKVDLFIDEQVTLSIFSKGKIEKVEPFSSTAHWVGDFLSFMDNQLFFIKHANEHQMVFGELESPGNINEKIKWVLEFKRVA
jgi:hypothetical protein